MVDFEEVKGAWDVAPVTAIHPLRHKSDTAYWQSGVYQAEHAAAYIPEGGTVVDFGCGDGRLTIPLARMGFDVVAVDASKNMLKRLAVNLKDMPGESVLVHMIRSDGFDLALSDVDVIVARAVLIHHSHADVARLVVALSRILKPGGFFVADWPIGGHYERVNWTDVTTWEPEHRLVVGETAGLELVEDGTPTVWRKL